ncbi:mucoidy inhibitor MuiA family protein [Flagellimonas sp. 389]|uniref:mucoidy inhibitor MuiA family protein n=1 Tax=Flagellimonas sp. 389 TaxID=2835862 RepID=UPI001BD4AA3B|nr:mucoidy inhibitor MuiA family protein [Flagellimonas sp. 389]MBS9463426.1 mucoidy inhibitor MuiA family protein [Flagellimonas sp. 389]
MKKLILLVLFIPLIAVGNDLKVPSEIKKVTVYLSGAQVYRKAECKLHEGTNEIVFTGLSSKIQESSIQISGLQAVSILSMSYDLNYLEKTESNPQVTKWEDEILQIQHKITLLKNLILGLEEEEKVITSNRMISANNQTLDLEKVKEISVYYRERITSIKNEIFETNLKINGLNLDVSKLRMQLAEVNNAPQQEQGELTIKFDAPIATSLDLSISYLVNDAGWIPNYDIKSKKLNAPLDFTYKAHVYQKTGKDWDNVNITLSTGNPNVNVSKPHLGTKYLNFVNRYAKLNRQKVKRKGYIYNPTVREVAGTIVDQAGNPLPGANIMVKGSNKGTQTDFDGNFSLDVASGRELQISYIGFIAQELPIYSSVINVQMEEDFAALEEVVVTGGYGSAAVSDSSIRVRGNTSAAEPKSPLYVVDGVPQAGFIEGDLDENEIQSMEVLKGTEAVALYGSRGTDGIVVITTKKSSIQDDLTNTKFVIKKAYSIASDGDITAIEISAFQLPAEYEYFAAPLINENIFLTAKLKDWEKHQLLPGEANVYFEGGYAGKTNIDTYTVKKEMILSMGIDPNITVTRNQQRDFKSKSFTGSNRILNRAYDLEVKNNKNLAINLKLMDRIPISQNKEIKIDDIDPQAATHNKKTGLLTWNLELDSKESKKESFSFQVKYPKGKYISL